MPLQLDGYDLLPPEDTTPAGAPMQIALVAIDEDPQQPRLEFDEDALEELAASIRRRGVIEPISVRPHPEQPGRWMLNFGARRVRASKIAGRSHVPSFVDNAVDAYDQVIENEQRLGLKPLELALFVRKRLALGETQADIARLLGKSPTLITMVCALIDAPDWLMAAYRSGQCRGIAELYDLRRLNESQPERVAETVAQGAHITRATVKAMKTPAAASDLDASTEPRSAARTGAHGSASLGGATRQSLKDRAEGHCAALECILDEMRRGGSKDLDALRQRVAALVER
jgi:ParB family chromosome partitioning protein